jgi:hypothetical protein
VKWNEAQFATETQLKGEAAYYRSYLHPGNPFGVRIGVYYKF